MLKISSYTFSSEEVNSIDKNLSTPLYYAVSNNDLTFVIYLITLGADPNIQCIKGDTPLHIALKNNNE